MSERRLSPADHIAQYALLSRLVAAALAVVAAGGFAQWERGRIGLAVSTVLIVAGNYLALRRWPYVVDVLRVRDKPLYLVLDVALALSVILTVGAASPLVLYLVGSAVLAGLVYPWRFAVTVSVVVTAGYLAVLFGGLGAARGVTDVHSVLTLPALLLGAGPAAAAVRRLLRLRDQDVQAVSVLRSQMAVREERLRLSRDMHDTITKNLHGLALLAGGLGRAVERGGLAQARDTAELVALTARQLADSSREVILDLREDPAADFAQALHNGVRTAVAGHDLMLSWRAEPEFAARTHSLSASARAEILAVVGEAMHNVVKHAQAQTVTVEAGLDGDTAVLAVRDDGRGVCPEEAAAAGAAGHLGLVGMAERMHRVGGTVQVVAHPEGGTVVGLRVPLSGRAPAPTRTTDDERPQEPTRTVTEGAWHG